MKKYEKPTVMLTDGIAEGVYMASGDGGNGGDCYTVTAYVHQQPETGRGDYRIQVNAVHAAADSHHSGEQILTLTFNQDVEYVGSNGTYVSGSGTNTIDIKYNYHNNGNDNIGLGDVIVKSNAGLTMTPGAKLSCNYDCGQH